MRDAHQRIVDWIYQRVERIAVTAHDDVIGNMLRLERHLTTDEVVPHPRLGGHAKAKNRLTTFGAEGSLLLIGQVAVGIVVAKLGILARCLTSLLNLIGRTERLVSPT